jgi:hypothetical protein
VDVDPEALEEGFAGIAEQEQNRHNRIEEIIEPGMTRASTSRSETTTWAEA